MGKPDILPTLIELMFLALVTSSGVIGVSLGQNWMWSKSPTYVQMKEPISEGLEGKGWTNSRSTSKISGTSALTDSFEVECRKRSRCWPKSIDESNPPSVYDIATRNCFCDDLCETYDDCCDDYFRQSNSSVETFQLPPEVIACWSHGFIFRDKEDENRSRESQHFYLVNDCPSNYRDQVIGSYCRLGNNESSDPFFRLPVNGKTSKVLYLNLYCALCNGDSEVVFWTANLDECYNTSSISSNSKEDDQPLNSSISNTGETRKCSIIFDFPDGYRPRPCKKVIRECDEDWTDRETASKCEGRSQLTSYLYEKVSPFAILRNKYCAKCNNIDETDTTCAAEVKENDGRHGVSLPSIERISYKGKPVSFSVILKQGFVTSFSTSLELQKCQKGFVYDPFAKICRQFFYRKGCSEADTGHCRPSNRSMTGVIFSLVPTNNSEEERVNPELHCNLTISLNESEYKIFDSNQSAYVFHIDAWFTKDEYFHDPPFLYICSPFTSQLYNETMNITRALMFQYDQVQGYLSFIGVIVSLVSLLILFSVYMVFPVLRNTPGKCVVCLVVSLFIGQFSYLFVAYQSPVCFSQAAAMHFGFLAAFFWKNVLAFDICRRFTSTTTTTLSDSGSRSKHFLFFSLYAWATPAAIVVFCVVMDALQLDVDFRPHYSDSNALCWITNKTALLAFFIVPIGVTLFLNLVFFVVAVYCICKASRVAAAAVSGTQRKRQLFIYIKLSFIMGLTWIFGIVAYFTDLTVLWYLFICFNALQGAFLCVIFLCTKKVFGLVRNKWGSPVSAADWTTQKTDRKYSTSTIKDAESKYKSRRVVRQPVSKTIEVLSKPEDIHTDSPGILH